MKTKRRYIVLLVALVVALCGVAGEPVKIKDARFEPGSVLIGDHFDLVIEVECEEGSGVGFPAIGPEFAEGRIELLEDGRVDTLSSEGCYLLRKNYRMTSFEPASYRLDSLAVLAASAEGIDTLYAPRALELEVQIMPVDTAQKSIYDLKQPMKAPLMVEEFSGWVVMIVFVSAVLAALIYVIARSVRRRGGAVEEELPKRPPHIVAIGALEELHNQKLWQNGRVKEYYSRLTEIFRTYLAGRFGVGALEMTTEEIVAAMKSLTLTPKQMADLVALLTESDLVKFAKFIPEAESNEAAYYTIYYFVEESKEVAEEVVSPEEQEIEVVTPKEEEKSDE
jgi:hypothetical protein